MCLGSRTDTLVNPLILVLVRILDASFPLLDSSSNLFHNWINDTSSFLDTSGSTLLAYSAFRLASISPGDDAHVAAAESIYQATQGQLTRIGTYLTPVVNVLDPGAQGTTSAESMAFAILLEAARRDYHAGNVTGLDGPGTGHSSSAIPRRAADGLLLVTTAVTAAAAVLVLVS